MVNYVATCDGYKLYLLNPSLNLHTECSFVTAPVGEFNTSRLILNIKMENTSATAQTANTSEYIVNAVVTFRTTAELVINSSTCHISGLEVYRGKEQAFKIKHQGFSLTENGTIKVYLLSQERNDMF